MSTLLLLTVGTGTAGRHSDLARGLRATITQLAPRRFWLAPSVSADSRAMADLVREGIAAFAPASAEDPYFTLAGHDDLDGCRRTLRVAIATLRRELQRDEQLVVNPTSGTKQMTAAAVLAALDEGVGDIVFTVGDRADGVVRTGTERLAAFDPAGYFRERDLETARGLFAAGSFRAAARILHPHRHHLPHAHATATTLGHWRRLHYEAALRSAATGREDLRALLLPRSHAVRERRPAPEILADLLAWAQHALSIQDAETALATTYKALEYAARLAFHRCTGLVFPCPHRELARLSLSPDWLSRAAANQRADGSVAPGLRQIMQALSELGHALGRDYVANPKLQDLVSRRNDTVHDIRPIEISTAQATLERVRPLISSTLEPLPAIVIPRELPEA